MQRGVSAGWIQQQYAPAVPEKSEGVCLLADGQDAVSGVLQAAGHGLHSLLFQQPDCRKPALHQGIPPQAADGAVYTGWMGTDGVYQEKGVMLKILFLIHDLGQGGAEKVLVNLVNNMDRSKFDITVMSLFGGGVNEQFLKADIHYQSVFQHTFRGNSHIMKLLSPKQLHRLFIKEKFDIEISYLEGPSVRIISGCQAKTTKLVSWVHCTTHNRSDFSIGFRNSKEAANSYKKMNTVCFVSNEVMNAFTRLCAVEKPYVLYNINDSETIIQQNGWMQLRQKCSAVIICVSIFHN